MVLLNSLALLDKSPSLKAIYGCIFLCRIVERTLYKGTVVINGETVASSHAIFRLLCS